MFSVEDHYLTHSFTPGQPVESFVNLCGAQSVAQKFLYWQLAFPVHVNELGYVTTGYTGSKVGTLERPLLSDQRYCRFEDHDADAQGAVALLNVLRR